MVTPAIIPTPKKQANEYIQTYEKKTNNEVNKSKLNDDNDGKSLPQILSLLSNLKTSNFQDKVTEMQLLPDVDIHKLLKFPTLM